MSDEEEIPSELPDKVPKYVTTQSELARYLNVHRNTIIAWSKEPDAPKQKAKGYVVLEWLEHKSKMDKRSNAAKGDSKRAKEIEKLDEQIRGLRLENDRKDGLLVPMALVNQTLTALVSELRQEIRKVEDGLPLALAGLPLAEGRLKAREMFDSMTEKIHKTAFPLTGEMPPEEQTPPPSSEGGV